MLLFTLFLLSVHVEYKTYFFLDLSLFLPPCKSASNLDKDPSIKKQIKVWLLFHPNPVIPISLVLTSRLNFSRDLLKSLFPVSESLWFRYFLFYFLFCGFYLAYGENRGFCHERWRFSSKYPIYRRRRTLDLDFQFLLGSCWRGFSYP